MGSISHCNTRRSFYSLILLLMNEFQIANPMPSGADHTRGAEHGQCLASLLAACEPTRGTHHRLWLLLETNQCLSMTVPRQCGSSVWTQFICSLLQIQQCFFIGFLSYEEKTPKMHSIMLISFIFWEEDSWTAYFAACLYIAIHDCNQIKKYFDI